jgi:hypothetical protein
MESSLARGGYINLAQNVSSQTCIGQETDAGFGFSQSAPE